MKIDTMTHSIRRGALCALALCLCALGAVMLSSCRDGDAQPGPVMASGFSLDNAGQQALLDEAHGSHQLVFLKGGEALATRTLGALASTYGIEQWGGWDPYYKKQKRWKTLPLTPILSEVFGMPRESLREKEFVLRAKDGYSVVVSGEKLVGGEAYLAVEDMDFPNWEPVGPQQANPAPSYLVWRSPEQNDLHEWPRPFQLHEIDLASFDQLFAHTLPTDADPGSDVGKGFEIFKTQCIRCHAINRDGGHVGPDLNVPQNITEYRPEAQIRAYINNPLTFRYGNMPSFSHLSSEDIDHVIAYLKHMSTHKHDPDAATRQASE